MNKQQLIFFVLLNIQSIFCYLNDILLYSIGYWEIEQSDVGTFQLQDKSQYQNHGISINNIKLPFSNDRNDEINSSLDFSIPNSDFVTIPSIPAIQDFGLNWSISFYIQGPSTGTENGVIMIHEKNVSFQIQRYYQTSSILLNICRSDIVLGNILDGNWQQIVLSVDNGIYLNIIVNGKVRIQNKILDQCQPQSQNDICIGALCEIGGIRFEGKIDSIIFLKKTISLEEINYLLNQPQCPFYCNSCTNINGNLKCDTCRGDRVKIGNICKCPSNLYDDMTSENCQTPEYFQITKDDPLLLYMPLDKINGQQVGDLSGQLNNYLCQYNGQNQDCIYGQDLDGNGQITRNYMYFNPSQYGGDMQLALKPDAFFKFGLSDFTIMFNFKGEVDWSFYQQYMMCVDNGSIFTVSQTKENYFDEWYYSYFFYPHIEISIGGQMFAQYQYALDNQWHSLAIIRFNVETVGVLFDGDYQEYTINAVEVNISDSFTVGNCLVASEDGSSSYYYGIQGQIDELRVYNKKMSINDIKILNNFPQCPFNCPDCSLLQGRLICNSCLGNRVIDQETLTCVCPDGYEEDLDNQLENCQKIQSFVAYYQMDTNIFLEIKDISPLNFNTNLQYSYEKTISDPWYYYIIDGELYHNKDDAIAAAAAENIDESQVKTKFIPVKYTCYRGIEQLQSFNNAALYPQNNDSGIPLLELINNIVDNNCFESQLEIQHITPSFVLVENHHGESGKAMDFSQGLRWLQIKRNSDTYNFNQQDFSICIWIKAPKQGLMNGLILQNGKIVIQRQLTTENLQIQFESLYIIINSFFDDNWNHLSIIRRDVSYLEVYKNYKLEKITNVGSQSVRSSFTYLLLGAYNNLSEGDSGIFDGQLDEFRVYKKALQQYEIIAIMSFPQCPYFCIDDCIIDTELYITKCNSCQSNRIFDTNNEYCICPEGFEEDGQSEQCKEMIVQEINTLQLYYSFDSGVNDQSKDIHDPNTINGVLQNVEQTTDYLNNIQRAYQFKPESINSKIIIEKVDLLNFGLQDFTITFRIKGPQNSNYEWGQILGNDLINGIAIVRFQGSPDLRISINNVYTDVSNVFNDEWQFIAIQRQQQYVKVFLNDQFIQDGNFIGEQNLNYDQKTCIGRQCDNSLPFDGSIDELLIYNEAIPLQEIINLSNYICLFPCLECDFYQQGNVCKSCKGDRIFQNGQCLCPDGKFDDFVSVNCQSCNENCLLCTSLTDCTQCVDFYTQNLIRLIDNTCSCPQIGYYEKDVICDQCNNQRCLTCQDNQTCDTCVGSNQEQQIIRQQNKQCLCPTGFYDDIENQELVDCLPCQNKTAHCTLCELLGGECIECEGDLMYYEGKCQCPKGTYAQDLSNPNEIYCSACPSEKAVCNGGYEITLKQGFWRQNEYTDSILSCYNNPDNCIGGNSNLICKIGHKGGLCEACDLNNELGNGSYANSSEYECSPCDKVSNNGLKIFGLIMLQMVSLYIAVIGTTSAIQDQIQYNCLKLLFPQGQPLPDEQGVLIKILQNYLYIVSALLTFQIDIPLEISNLTTSTSTPAKAMAYSFDCSLNEMQDSIPNQYFRIVWQVVIGLLQLILVYIIGIVMIKLGKTKMTFVSLFWTALIYQYIALQPAILTLILETMACRQIDNQYYLLNNTSIQCFDNTYNTYTYGLLFPLLFIWVIVIPTILYQTLKKIKKQDSQNHQIKPIKQSQQFDNQEILDNQYNLASLEKPQTLQKYGYLYLEYKQSVFWWEFVKIFQRIVIATVLSFYFTEIIIKGLMVLMTVVLYGVLQYKYHPYKNQSQNDMDQLSIFVTGITLICGLFLYQNDYIYLIIIAAIFMIFINVYFITTILKRILYAKGKDIIEKITQQKEKQEHQKLYEQNLKTIKQLEQQLQEQENFQKNTPQEQQNIMIVKNQIKKLKDEISQLDLLYIEEFKENQKKQKKKLNKKQIDQQQQKNGILVNIFTKIEEYQVKFLGYPTAQTLQQVQEFKNDIRNYFKLYIDGINSGFIQPMYDGDSILNQKIQLKKSQLDSQYLFSSLEFINGKVKDEQFQELEKQIDLYKMQQKSENIYIQRKLREYLALTLKNSQFENKYCITEYVTQQNQEQNSISNQSVNKQDVKIGQNRSSIQDKTMVSFTDQQNTSQSLNIHQTQNQLQKKSENLQIRQVRKSQIKQKYDSLKSSQSEKFEEVQQKNKEDDKQVHNNENWDNLISPHDNQDSSLIKIQNINDNQQSDNQNIQIDKNNKNQYPDFRQKQSQNSFDKKSNNEEQNNNSSFFKKQDINLDNSNFKQFDYTNLQNTERDQQNKLSDTNNDENQKNNSDSDIEIISDQESQVGENQNDDQQVKKSESSNENDNNSNINNNKDQKIKQNNFCDNKNENQENLCKIEEVNEDNKGNTDLDKCNIFESECITFQNEFNEQSYKKQNSTQIINIGKNTLQESQQNTKQTKKEEDKNIISSDTYESNNNLQKDYVKNNLSGKKLQMSSKILELSQQNYDLNEQDKIAQYIIENSDIFEIKEFLISFKLLDEKNTGKVQKKQIAQIMKKLGIKLNKGDIDNIYETFDINDDQVDFISFIAKLLQQKYYKKPRDIIKELFSKFDIAYEGVLNADQLEYMMKTLFHKKYDKQVYKVIVQQIDRQQHRGINLDQFTDLII